ncbi:MAG: NPCBM/NEW2 domain-containing protein [Ruminococcus sp.]|nr:NPCBM/NEW2 domain-containing protein [Ruminococcus sp.]
MKARKIKRSIVAILMIAVLMVGTSVVSVGAETQKTYLMQMLYSEINNYAKENQFTSYSDRAVGTYQCKNAVLFDLSDQAENYSSEIQQKGKTFYSLTYDLNGKYNGFYAGLTHLYNMSSHAFVLEIFGDNNLLFRRGINGDSPYEDIYVDVSNVNKLTFKISYYIYSGSYIAYGGRIVLDNAYFTSEDTTPEPTSQTPTEKSTQKPTQEQTQPTVKPTVAPTTAQSVESPTKEVEDSTKVTNETTSSEETTSTKIYPTASTNATSKVSTSDTATKDSANKGTSAISNYKGNSDNGTIQTGAISIAVIIFLILASLATGGFAWYRRKIK